ncbi:MAG: aminopeptidase P family protein [Desulfobacterales bacterium]|nr:aminopeptidase P family protein [Desulfobacterales bacterium]
MNTNEKIDHIRQLMRDGNIAAVIIPSDDPHQSEYVAEHWQARKWLTGFSGSAGTAVVTLEHAILWTDFRYYIQAEKQISGSRFELYKMGESDVPTFQKWLINTLKPEDTIGIDANVFSMADVKKYKTQFEAKGLLLDTDIDFIKTLWTGRPARPMSTAFSLSEKFAGKSRKDKVREIRKQMDALDASYHLMATLDDIAWTLNLRGQDVHTNPVNIAFLLVAPKKVSLFVSYGKIDNELAKELKRDSIEIAEYEGITAVLSNIQDDRTILVDPENTNYRLYQAINKKCKIVEKPNPAIALKAIKNDIEIAHLKHTAVKDGTAVVNFLFWLEHQHEDTQITEQSVADKLYAFRKDQELFVDNSFDPIMAYQEHSAMCHYSATKETDAVIGNTGMFLTDSGGNYFTGTTDITRTICRGEPLKQEITDYTLVLKGHISVATALFPKGTKGFQIDTLSRQYLWNKGLDFGHGTGHGVGFFLCVHEGPAKISPHPIDVKLEKGMVLTNEPGIYREGAYGIRLENMILVDHAFENEFGTFMKFETLTNCHFERNLIDINLLSKDEKEWINTYHARVYDKLSPNLDQDVASWLKEKTKAI